MTKERSSSNTRRPIDTSLSNSFSSGVSSLSSSNYGVRTVRVFKNGDPYHQGTKFVVNRRYVHDLDHMLNLLSEKIDLPYGAKRLFTTNGKLVRHLNDIEDKQDYVASSNQFIPLKYGNTTTSIGHPFRSTSPINMITPQSRQSRSQTRSESRPAVIKRSQSGLTSASTTSEKNAKPGTKSGQGTPSKKTADGKPKKKVVKKKKKTESEVIIPVANEKEETKETKKEVKEEKKEEKKKEEEKKVEEKKTEEKNEEIVVPPATEETPRTIERSPSPKKEDSSEKPDASDEEHKEEKSRSPSPAGHSGGSATEHEDHSGSEKHSDANETDAEKSPRPVRKPTPKPNGKEQPKSDKSSGESGSDKESDE